MTLKEVIESPLLAIISIVFTILVGFASMLLTLNHMSNLYLETSRAQFIQIKALVESVADVQKRQQEAIIKISDQQSMIVNQHTEHLTDLHVTK